MDRLATQFVILGDVAYKALNYEEIFAKKVQVAVFKTDMQTFKVGTFKMLAPKAVFEDNKILLEFEDVPIEVKLLEKKYTFIKYPNRIPFFHATYFIPNQFEKYWKMRNLLR